MSALRRLVSAGLVSLCVLVGGLVLGGPAALAAVAPEAVTGGASGATSSAVTLEGAVNPGGELLTSCQFEYGLEESYGGSVPCSQSLEEIGGEESPVALTAPLAGLEPNATYHYRLSVSNEVGSGQGQDQTFTTQAVPPTVAGSSVSSAAESSVTLMAQVNPNGADTTYYFQYGPSAGYGTSVPAPPGSDMGSGREAQTVSAHIQGLHANTLYHYRVVAINSAGIVEGPDRTLATTSLGMPFVLPDGRAFELVSPPDKNGGDIQTQGEGFLLPSQSSLSGDAIAYVSRIALPDSSISFQNADYLSSRTANGWSTQSLDPPQFNRQTSFNFVSGNFREFSLDLSKSVVTAANSPVVSGAPQEQENVYVRDNASGAYQLLTSADSTNGSSYSSSADAVNVEGASADFSHVIFSAKEQLTPEAFAFPRYAAKAYEWTDGQLRMVSVLPDGTPTEGNFGQGGLYVSHAISADGSRIFWRRYGGEPGENGRLYVRENGVSTVPVSNGAADFEGASSDGSRVIFTEGFGEGDQHLYVHDLDNGQTTDLTPAGGPVKVVGVLGASDDLSYIYVVAEGVLAGGATAGQPNLYMLHEEGGSWTTTYIATLAINSDRYDWGEGIDRDLTGRTAEVASDGKSVVFMSVNSLTGYENAGDSEVYLYDARSGLTCVSCNPSGVTPAGSSRVPAGSRNIYQARYLSSDGGRVFFDSGDALVSGDGNGLQDVYEWERDGTGSCRSVGGCVYLLSGARSGFEAVFADASGDGSDVFFTTRAQLEAGDRDQSVDLYDARVGGGFAQSITPPSCSGGGCREAGGAAPVFGSPLSASFVGTGNAVALASTPGVKAKAKAKVKKRKAKRKLKRSRGRGARRARVGRGLSGARARHSS